MAVSPTTLGDLVKANVDTRISQVFSKGHHPLSQHNPSYFIEFCEAIGQGIILGAPTINYTSNDFGTKGTPFVAGAGAGIGIVTDPIFFVEDLYNRIRSFVIADFGRTAYPIYPPGPTSGGQYLKAICEGINDSFLSYYPTAWTLASTHPQIYMGTGSIIDGQFSGVNSSSIQSQIISLAPDLHGRFWPRIAQAVAESYQLLIQSHSTGTVTITGTCTPVGGISPQVCDIHNQNGTGSVGTAT